MSGVHRTPEQRLSDEAARWRKSCQEARSALRDANRMLLGVYLRDQLADPADFEVYVDAASVVDRSGRIVWTRVDVLVAELLTVKPHLAAPGLVAERECRPDGLPWVGTET